MPFFLRTGKRLPKRATEIAIQFHRPPTDLFEAELDGQAGANQLVLRIQPNEGASLTFEAKVPGSRRRLQEVRMDFRYGTAFAVPPPEAYERLLLDAMLGDPTLYTRTDEVESAWRFITRILDAWQLPGAPPPVTYPAGTWGPEAADALIAGTGRSLASTVINSTGVLPWHRQARLIRSLKDRASRSSSQRSRPSSRSYGGRRPSRRAARSSRIRMSPGSCWRTWSSSAWTAMTNRWVTCSKR